MTLEATLAAVHFLAIMTLVVFLGSQAALCRTEWLNAAVVHRLVRLDLLYAVAALLVLASGLARAYWGMKGGAWYWSQPLLHAKLTVFVLIGLLSLRPTLRFRQWRRQLLQTGALPEAAEVQSTRRWVMWEAHLLMLLPVLGALLARGVGTR
ncbi:DUF2214 family protein [Roseateles sp. BYS180W]|uniref:DUF2214 family protein n=1 Tax=Roseateles rivi TaxID=3299028 RepID=A0ABW7FTV8_9BURK